MKRTNAVATMIQAVSAPFTTDLHRGCTAVRNFASRIADQSVPRRRWRTARSSFDQDLSTLPVFAARLMNASSCGSSIATSIFTFGKKSTLGRVARLDLSHGHTLNTNLRFIGRA